MSYSNKPNLKSSENLKLLGKNLFINMFSRFKSYIYEIYLIITCLTDIFVNFIAVTKLIVKFKAYLFPDAFVTGLGEKFAIIVLCFIMLANAIYFYISVYICFALYRRSNDKKMNTLIYTIWLIKNFFLLLLLRT